MATKTITCTRLARTKRASTFANHSNTNWGLIRHTSDANPFTSLSYSGTENYTYTYDDNHGQGENVDIIFITAGMIYTDNAGYKTSGVSRINQFDWRTLTNSPTTVNVDYSTSATRSNHSEQVVACACHNDYGAATAANIYIIPRTQIVSPFHFWALPKLFHQQKGNSNPTIVVTAFGSLQSTTQIGSMTFRGTKYRTYKGRSFNRGWYQGANDSTGFTGNGVVRVPTAGSYLTLLEEMTDAGVIHFTSAGNSRHKADVPGGVDYNNKIYKWTNDFNYLCARATYGENDDSIHVGNLDSWFNDGNTQVTEGGDNKEVCPYPGEFSLSSSNRGPRVDCYVAGTAIPMIIPSTSTSNFTIEVADINDAQDNIVLTLPTGHGLVVGDEILITGSSNSQLNTTHELTAVTSDTVTFVVSGYGAQTTTDINVAHINLVNGLSTGTSFASPTLAGLAAMVASKYPNTTPAQMRKYVREVAVSSATMGDTVVQPKVSDGDKGDPDYFEPNVSQNSNLKITYIDPSLSYDPSGITDTTITYPTETLQPLSTTVDKHKRETRRQTKGTY